MADISKEIQDFEDAELGEQVRGSMISLAQKVNAEVENNTQGAAQAASYANKAADRAEILADHANSAATNANNAATHAEETRQDILDRLAAGEFKGEPGEPGDTGAQGVSGVTAPSAGMFSLYLDPATGDLWADYPDGAAPPVFEYDADTGDLYYVTG